MSVFGTQRRLAFWFAIVLVYAIAVGFLPLFDTLGFELAIASSLVAAIVGLDVGAALARGRQRIPVTMAQAGFVGRSVVGSALRASAVAVALALIPGVVAAIRGLWHTTCDWTFGITCYATMALVTA